MGLPPLLLDFDIAFADLLTDLASDMLLGGGRVGEGLGLALTGRANAAVADRDLATAHVDLPKFARGAANKLKAAFAQHCHRLVSFHGFEGRNVRPNPEK